VWIAGIVVAAAWAGKWDGAPSDVEARQVIAAPTQEIHELLRDHRAWRELVPTDCATDWALTAQTAGPGARARVRWTIGPMRRLLTAVYTRDQPGLLIELEHEGKKGWFTQVRYAEAPAGSTEVRLSTPLVPPPWPVRGVFFSKVRPAWEDCYARTLSAVAARLTD
jgi:hypothetical protein